MKLNLLLSLAFLFFIGSTFGFVFELFLRRFVTRHRWMNPGFLSGPYLPIYGFGLVIMFLVSEVINLNFIKNNVMQDIFIILLIGILMTLIEYIAGLIFIKIMNIKLWDYSKEWGNIQGIICPLFSLIWTIFGTIYYYFINPYIEKILVWLSNNLAFSFFIGLFFGFVLVDTWNSFNISNKIKQQAKANNIIVKFENLKLNIQDKKLALKEKINFILPFNFNQNFKVEVNDYIEKEKNEPPTKKDKNLKHSHFNKQEDNNENLKPEKDENNNSIKVENKD